MSKSRSVSNADVTTAAQVRSPASSALGQMQQQGAISGGGGGSQRDTPLLQQQQSVKSSSTKAASTPFNSQTPSSQQQQLQAQSQASTQFASLHSCPGPELVDEWWSGDDLSSDDEDEDNGSGDAAPSLLTPPLIPPFRFAMVECSRPVSVGGGAQSGSNNSSGNNTVQSSPANASSSQSQLQSVSGSVGSPHTQHLKSIKSNASLSSLSTVSSSSSIASLSGSAAPSPSHAAGSSGPPPLGRRSSLNNSIPINLASLANAAAQRPTQQPQQQQPQQPQGSQSNLASAAGGVSSTAGLPLTSPPTSPSRVFAGGMPAAAAASTASSASAGAPAQSVPAQLTPALASASHSGKHTCMRGLGDHSVYRGSYPTLKNLHFLARLGLRSIVSLTPEPPSADLKKFCRDGGFDPAVMGVGATAATASAGSASIAAISTSAAPASSLSPTPIRLYHFPVSKWSPEKDGDIVSVTSAQVSQILPLLINAASLPVYVHCIDGCNTTGIVIACLRKLQCWSMLSIVSEFLRFTRDTAGVMTDAEKTFLGRFNHQGLGGGHSIPSAAMISNTGAAGGGANNAAASDVAASASLLASSKSSKAAPPAGPNILLRIPAALPNWLWGGMHLAVHPLGIRLYDAHVPAFAALHAKQLTPIDPTAANTVPPTPASIAAAAALAVHAGWRLLPALDGSDRPALDPLATTTASSAAPSTSPPDLPPLLHLEGDGSLWDGLQLVEPLSPVSAAGLLAGAIPETDKERKKRKKKEKEQEKKDKADAASAAASATSAVDPAPVAIGCCSGQPLEAPSDESVSGAPEFPTQLKKAPSADGTAKPKGSASTIDGSNTAAAVPPSLPPSTHPSRSPTPASASVSAASSSDASAATATAPLVSIGGSPAPAASSVAAPATAVPAPTPVPAPAPAPAPSLLSHPGEFHSLADLEASQWGKTRSSLAAEMLFHAGSFEIPGAIAAVTEDGAPSLKLPPRELSLWPEDQFIEHPDDPDLTLTRDEFDTDVSLLLASLALEGFTMNHKISRPMQLFHSDQGEA